MEARKYCSRFFVLVAYIAISATTFFTLTHARHVVQFSNLQGSKVSKTLNPKPTEKPNLSIHQKLYVSEAEATGISTPFSIESNSIAPLSSPPKFPAPISVYPPFPPNVPFPIAPAFSLGPNPSSSYGVPIPPLTGPIPNPPKVAPIPPAVNQPSFGPTHPPHKEPKSAVWCVAKPAVQDSIMQQALDYACGSGADCKSIQPNGPCFQPNILFSHASYAFNNYWQKTKLGGGTCDFGGTAMLIPVDPSFGDCHFIYN